MLPAHGSGAAYGRLRRLRPRRCRTHQRLRRRSSSPPTAATDAARWSGSRNMPTRRSPTRPLPSRRLYRRQADWSRRRWSPAGTSGGTTWSTASRGLPGRAGRVRACSISSTRQHDRQAQGHLHTTGGHLVDVVQPLGGLRHQGRRRVLVCGGGRRVTGHTYIVYGLLANAMTGHVRGRAGHAGLGPLVAIIEDCCHHPVLRPTAIRAFMKQSRGRRRPSTLRPGLGGEPTTQKRGSVPRAYRTQRALVDTWWQTETGDPHHATPRVTATKPGQQPSRSLASTPTSSTRTATPCRSGAAATSS